MQPDLSVISFVSDT